jgi:hypothetical protein
MKTILIVLFCLISIKNFSQSFSYRNDCEIKVDFQKVGNEDTNNYLIRVQIQVSNLTNKNIYIADSSEWRISKFVGDSINLIYIDLGYWYISMLRNDLYNTKLNLFTFKSYQKINKSFYIHLKKGLWSIRVGNDYLKKPMKNPIDFQTYFLHSIKGQVFITTKIE